jgi:DNA repair exonuclease SbcCD ATPase subunit
MYDSIKMSSKSIDFLFEDPVIPSQRFALISIVGPHMPQKCDVWGLKIRGVAETLEKAKALTQKLMRIDNNYDIYTVDIGKFFPLQVEPTEIGDVEYQNSQLNDLIKSYLENRERANEEWHTRKNEMIQEAIREGKNQEELANKPEHPIVVLQRIQTYEERIKDLTETLESFQKDLELSQQKFSGYTEEEREIAAKEIKNAIETVTAEASSSANVEEIRKQLIEELDVSVNPVDNIIENIKKNEAELDELQTFLQTVDKSKSPNIYARISKNVEQLQKEVADLKAQLNNTKVVNDYINSAYPDSPYNNM